MERSVLCGLEGRRYKCPDMTHPCENIRCKCLGEVICSGCNQPSFRCGLHAGMILHGDFKCTLGATSWHCQTPEFFHLELLMHMIVCCLIRIAMIGACRQVKLSVGQLSFACALTETRLILKLLLAVTDADLWASIWTTHVACCAKHPVRYKPDRQFTRDRQEYRRKSRGQEKRRKK